MNMIRSAAFALAVMTSGAAYAGAPGWTVSESTGAVTISRAGISKVAVRGGALVMGDFVSTSGNGRAVLVRGQEYLVVSPNSRIRIADPVASGGFTQIIQSFGNTIFRIKKKSTPHFAVETPYLAAVVKGTTFSVTVTDAGTAVQVTEGLVQVSTNDGGATHLVRPGDIGLVDAAMPLRLKIEGKESQVIDSPKAPSAAPVAPAEVAAAATEAFAEESNTAAASFDSEIGSPVSEGSVKLETVTGGLISGNPVVLAFADTMPRGDISPKPPVQDVIDAPGKTPPVQVPASLPDPVPVVDTLPPVDVSQSPPAPAPVDPIVELPPVVPVEVVTAPLPPVAPVEVAIVTLPPAVPDVTAPFTGGGTSPAPVLGGCTGVANCNGSTFTGTAPVVNGANCAGVPNCDGGAANLPATVPPVIEPTPVVTSPVVTVGNGNNGNGNANGQSNGNGNAGGQGNGNNGNGNGNANGQTPVEVVTVITPPVVEPVVIPNNGNNGNGNGNGNGNANGQNNGNGNAGGSGNGTNGNGNANGQAPVEVVTIVTPPVVEPVVIPVNGNNGNGQSNGNNGNNGNGNNSNTNPNNRPSWSQIAEALRAAAQQYLNGQNNGNNGNSPRP